jgi:2-polyprenyl-3-methyl-5-hydroxy-6-metoxy-1,4-benzoquinol methylase
MTQVRERSPSSFRDPSGHIFYENGVLYRQVNLSYKEHYERLMGSGLYHELTAQELLISHQEVSHTVVEDPLCYTTLQPQPVPFISYPYEWCFSQLKDAAIATLSIQRTALGHGMWLKDSSAYNIQFIGSRPVLIDTLSFETYEEGAPWPAYRQFCQHFLAPLALMSLTDLRLGGLSRLYIDGVSLELAARLLPLRARLRPSLYIHIFLHGIFQRRYADTDIRSSKQRLPRASLLGMIDSLESTIRRLKPHRQKSEWSEYYSSTTYCESTFSHKRELVSDYLSPLKAKTVWDIGANVGAFSRIASKQGSFCVSFDTDTNAVEANYQLCLAENDRYLLPLVLDLANPSPSLGWEHRERMSLTERGPADVVLALALLHHLAIGNNVPLERIAECFSRLGMVLIVEFVPKEDSQVQRMLLTREDIFNDYNLEGFERAFDRYFVIEKSERLVDSERMIYLLRKR